MGPIRTDWVGATVLVLACALAGAAVGIFTKPPSGEVSEPTLRASVLVTPVDPLQLQRARVPRSNAGVPSKSIYSREPGEPYGAWIHGSDANPNVALGYALTAGLDYAKHLTRHENTVMRRRSPPPRIRELQSAVMRQPTRFRVQYALTDVLPPTHSSSVRAPLRTGLVGAVVGLLLFGLARVAAARRPALAGADGVTFGTTGRLPAAGATIGALALVGLVAAIASTSTAAYTAVLIAGIVAFAFACARAGGLPAVRVLVGVVIVVSALRGALLGVSKAIQAPDGLTLINAIQPAIVAGCALSVLLERRGRFPRDARPLLVGWALIAGVAILDLATQTVGYGVYAIGLAQYLTYPTLAVLAWLSMERGDSDRLVLLLVAVATVVAFSVFLEAAGLVRFVEATNPRGDIGVGARFGGATGSYLHASIFLGTAAVLALGLVLEWWHERRGLVVAAALVMIVAGMGLTLSRGGFAIAGVGALALLVGAGRRDRLRLVGAGVAVVLAAAVLGLAGGVTPGKVGSRLHSALSTSNDPGNKSRFERMRRSVDRFKDLPADQKVAGEGLAATGNARVVASERAVPTESYPLKLLLEVGLFGALIIGGYLVWALSRFARASIRGPDRLARSAAAAGLGLTLYAALYPTLEVQLLAMTWWLLLVACLAAARTRRRVQEGTATRKQGDVAQPEPVAVLRLERR